MGRRSRPRRTRRSFFKDKRVPKRGRQECGKRGYRDKVEAVTALHLAQNQHGGNGLTTEERVYECPLCRWWHLTSQKQRSIPT
jgi:hypothetical protein